MLSIILDCDKTIFTRITMMLMMVAVVVVTVKGVMIEVSPLESMAIE